MTDAPLPLTEPAPAKVNLYLHVLGRRADGYHELDSLVAFADVGDTVVLLDEAGGEAPALLIEGPFADQVPRGPDNSVVRAASALAGRLGRPASGLRFRLVKRLPPASGIGGGSADAAAALRLLARHWGLDPTDARIGATALALGADVPACLAGRTAFLGGIGERLDPGPSLGGLPILLVNAGRPVSTPAVFACRGGPFAGPARFALEAGSRPRDLARLLAGRANGLTEAAIEVEPLVRRTLEVLGGLDHALLVRLSGSGGTCFALFESMEEMRDAARLLRASEPGWWVAPARLL